MLIDTIKKTLKEKPGSYTVTVWRGDSKRAGNESAFFHALKKALQAAGHDVIKKCPDKDGHMLSDPYYVRERKAKWAITDPNASIESPHRDYNQGKPIKLFLHIWEN